MVPTRQQIHDALGDTGDYPAAGGRFGIPPGRAYLIATGLPADGSPATTDEPRDDTLGSRAQALVNPREVNPTARGDVHAWVRRRAYADASMRPQETDSTSDGGPS